MPIRYFKSAKKMSEKAKKIYKKRGIDLKKRWAAEQALVSDFMERSTNSKLFYINGDHNSMYTIKANADIICRNIIELYDELKHQPISSSTNLTIR